MLQRAYANHPFRTTGAIGLVLGPILIVVFSMLMPGGGFDARDPADVAGIIADLGGDAAMAQTAMIATALGGALYLFGIAGLARTGAGAAAAFMGFGVIVAAASYVLLVTAGGIGLGQTAASENAVAGSAAAGAVATALHSARLGLLQMGAMVTGLSLIVVGWGAYKGAATPKTWGLIYAALGLAMVVIPWILPVREEAGQMVFGIMMFVWAVLTIPAGYYVAKSAADNPPMAAATAAAMPATP